MGSEQRPLVPELTRAMELLRQLQANLDQPFCVDSCKILASDILSCLEKANSVAKLSYLDVSEASLTSRSEKSKSNHHLKDQEPRVASKKRKTLPKWTRQVKVGTGEGINGPIDDGCSWRKYGQKDILGAKYPRGYYRCTHRSTLGCPAVKQVQRSGENPSFFDVTYHGVHTCHQSPRPEPESNQEQQPDLLLSFQNSLRIKTQVSPSTSFSFPSTPVNCPKQPDNCFKGSFSPASFISPATTSESNYLAVSPCSYGGGSSLPAAESEFMEIMSANSVADSPFEEMDDFLIDPAEFGFLAGNLADIISY